MEDEDYERWFIQEVEKGLAAAERGELLEHEEVVERIEKYLEEKKKSNANTQNDFKSFRFKITSIYIKFV